MPKLLSIPEAKIENLYWGSGLSLRKIAKILGCGQITILQKMIKYNISRRPANKFVQISRDELKKLYYQDRLTVQEIADVFNCNVHTICRKLKKFNISIIIERYGSESNNYLHRLDGLDEKFKYLYLVKQLSLRKIAKKFGCTKPTIAKRLKNCGVQIRESIEAVRLLDRFGKNNSAYIDGRTDLRNCIRHLSNYTSWRNDVFQRDNYTCQKCGKNKNIYLEAHHDKKSFVELMQEFLQEYNQFSPIEDKETLVRLAIKWQPFWDVTNGETLCIDCHRQTFNYRGKTIREEAK